LCVANVIAELSDTSGQRQAIINSANLRQCRRHRGGAVRTRPSPDDPGRRTCPVDHRGREPNTERRIASRYLPVNLLHSGVIARSKKRIASTPTGAPIEGQGSAGRRDRRRSANALPNIACANGRYRSATRRRSHAVFGAGSLGVVGRDCGFGRRACTSLQRRSRDGRRNRRHAPCSLDERHRAGFRQISVCKIVGVRWRRPEPSRSS